LGTEKFCGFQAQNTITKVINALSASHKQLVIDLSAEDGHTHQHVVFQPQIVERASTQHRG
jgi:hypothetical protein